MRERNTVSGRIKWIDCAKAIAIIAVVVNHCCGFCYNDQLFAQTTYFSVSLFILLSGISAGLSCQRRKPYTYQLKKCGRLFGQYAAATLIIQAYYSGCLDLRTYVNHIISFDIQPPFYYLLFFLQIMLISPFLLSWYKFCIKQKYAAVWHAASLLALGYFSYVFIQKTYILPVYGGGQYLFGGTYLLLFYMGIILSNSRVLHLKKLWEYLTCAGLAGCIWGVWLRLRLYGRLPFDKWMLAYWGDGLNPPSIELMVYALITLFLLFSVFTMVSNIQVSWLEKLVNMITLLGKNTLYTFMYHLLVRDVLLNLFPVLNSNIWLRRGIVFWGMVILPVAGVSVVRYCGKIVHCVLKETE